ncbi:MAG TPA: S8 family serine peptidase [Thermoanaerobaculia bacterium]|jgi:subtilisin family serine protease|nr:S8 family serine peptidase [Thermoanaerobaculia bacterium]
MAKYKALFDGEELQLEPATDRFVSRASLSDLEKKRFTVGERLSPGSVTVLVKPSELKQAMNEARDLGAAAYRYMVTEMQRPLLTSDRLFVRFREPRSEQQVRAFARKYRARVIDNYDNNEYLLRLSYQVRDPHAVVKRMLGDALVAVAEPDLNHQIRTMKLTLPTTPDFAEQWHLHDALQSQVSTHCDEAWRMLGNYGSPEVIIGLTDGGVDTNHPAFNVPGQQSSVDQFFEMGYFRDDWIRTTQNPRFQVAELLQSPRHGTAMAALIGADINSGVGAGVAPGCRLLPVSFEIVDGKLLVATSRVRTAFRFLSNRADVISNSWGAGEEPRWGRCFRDEVTRLAETGGKRGKGVVFVWAAGNSNCPIALDLVTEKDIPIDNGRDGFGRRVPPKTTRMFRNEMTEIPGVLHVGAVASTGHRSHYSNYGPALRLCAPSDNYNLYGNNGVVPPSLPIRSAPSTSALQVAPGGTSTACAIVAGIAGLVISANPELTGPEVVSILQKTAKKNLVTTPYPKNDLPIEVSPVAPYDDGQFKSDPQNYPDGTWSPWFGYGAVDAGAAVAEALNRRKK